MNEPEIWKALYYDNIKPDIYEISKKKILKMISSIRFRDYRN